jgi:cell division protein FtsW (lipid II flippase)
MALRDAGAGVRSPARNGELVLLAAAAGFILLGWRALELAAAPLPTATGRIVAQFLASALAGHVALRWVAPRAAGTVYGVASLLAAVGLTFTLRLAPDQAQTQANWVTLGVALMVAAAWAGRRYTVLRRYRYTAAAAAVALLLVTGFFGETINGARLWISIAGQEVQTTEAIKLLVVVFLAGYLADEASVLAFPRLRFGGRTYSALPYLLPLVVGLGVAIAALALLRDLGSIALLVLLAVSALYVATGRLRFVAGGVVLLASTAALGYVAFDHAEARIDAWLDPYADPRGTGYQTLQATYAIQAGGITGEGLGLGSPESIPAAPTDYVFSAVAEELGLAGALGLAMVYVVLLYAGLRVAVEARDTFGRLLAASIALLISLQAAVIIAGNLRVIPTTGITLPFVSYGGSSLAVNFVLVGLLIAVSERSRREA